MLKNILSHYTAGLVCLWLLLYSPIIMAQIPNPTTSMGGGYFVPSTSNLGATFSRPGSSLDYFLDNATWLYSGNSTYIYNTKGQLMERHIMDPTTGLSYQRFSYTYDLNGNEIGNLVEGWNVNNNNWSTISGNNKQLTYTPQGKISEITHLYWTNNYWANKKKYYYSYDSSGNLLEEKIANWTGTTWKVEFKIDYQYTNNIVTKISHYILNFSGTWVNSFQYINLTWHNPTLLQLSGYTEQSYYNGTFSNTHRSNIVYSPNGSIIKTIEGFINGNWTITGRQSYLNDSLSNYIGQREEYWSNNAWQISTGEQHYLTYNSSNDLIQRIIWYYKPFMNSFIEERKEVYNNFQQFTTGLNEEVVLSQANIFPNPTQQILHIYIPKAYPGDITAKIIDVTGKIVNIKTIETGTNHVQLSTETLQSGIYILSLQTSNSHQTFKIVKQ